MPVEEIKRISELAKSRGLKMHLDGARLFEASQATGTPMKEYGQYFDSVSVCLSKGCGAPYGSILISNQKVITQARHIRKLMGGGVRQVGGLAKVALHCVQNIVPTMPKTHQLTFKLAQGLQRLGFKLLLPCQTNMIFIDFSPLKVNEIADPLLAKHNIKIANSTTSSICRLALHYQIPPEIVDAFLSVAEEVAYLNKIEPEPLDSAICSRSSSVASSMVDLSSAYPSL